MLFPLLEACHIVVSEGRVGGMVRVVAMGTEEEEGNVVAALVIVSAIGADGYAIVLSVMSLSVAGDKCEVPIGRDIK